MLRCEKENFDLTKKIRGSLAPRRDLDYHQIWTRSSFECWQFKFQVPKTAWY